MKYTSANVGFFALAIISLSLVWLVIKEHPSSVGAALCLGLFFALLTPVVLMAVRREIWLARIRQIQFLRKTFKPGADIDFHFEFMRSKYRCAADEAQNSVKHTGLWRFLTPDVLLLISSIPFVLLTASMAFILFLSPEQLSHMLEGSLGATILSVGGVGEAGPKDYENAMTIAVIAFAGAFLYCLRRFIKELLAFDLSAISFLRAFVHILFAIALAIVVWRVLPDASDVNPATTRPATALDRKGPSKDAHALSLVAAAPSPAPLSRTMILLAFAVGFLPGASFAWMARKARLLMSRRSASLAWRTADIPLTSIGGIDFPTAYRLQELNVPNVQRLATANALQLEVETGAGLLAILDWIAQAQLCVAAGAERFVLLNKLNIRTIFDLERAVLDPASPAALKQMVGAALLASDGNTSIFRNFGVRPREVSYDPIDKALTPHVNLEVIQHLVFLITKDLHIKALRQIWQATEAAIGAASEEIRLVSPLRGGGVAAAGKLAQTKVYEQDGPHTQAPLVPFGLKAMPEH